MRHHGGMETARRPNAEPTTSQFVIVDAGSADGSARFELRRDGELVSSATYRLEGDVFVVPYMETLPQYRGNGFADRLMEGMVEILRGSGRTIEPLCSFAAGYLRDHPEHADVVHRSG